MVVTGFDITSSLQRPTLAKKTSVSSRMQFSVVSEEPFWDIGLERWSSTRRLGRLPATIAQHHPHMVRKSVNSTRAIRIPIQLAFTFVHDR